MRMKTTAKEASELKVSSKAPKVNSLTQVNSKSCFHCGKKGHTLEDCYFRMQKCRKCNKFGHIYKVCHKPPTDSTKKPSQGRKKPSKDTNST